MNLANKITSVLEKYKLPFTVHDIQNWTNISKFIDSYLYEDHDIDTNDFFKLYEDCIELAMTHSNWKLIKCMWQGYYYHDRSCPDFRNIFKMAQFGNEQTFILGLYGALIWLDYNGRIKFKFEELKELARNNPHQEVFILIEKIIQIMQDENKYKCLEGDLDYFELDQKLIDNIYNDDTIPDDDDIEELKFEKCEELKQQFIENLMIDYNMYEDYKLTNRKSLIPEDV